MKAPASIQCSSTKGLRGASGPAPIPSASASRWARAIGRRGRPSSGWSAMYARWDSILRLPFRPISSWHPVRSRDSSWLSVPPATPRSVMAAVQGALRNLDRALLIDNAKTMSERIDETVASRRLNLLLFELFAGLALLLAAVGLYGVVAYSAGQRSHEFGIRIALGAQGGDVLRLVMGQGLKLALIGTATRNGGGVIRHAFDDRPAVRGPTDRSADSLWGCGIACCGRAPGMLGPGLSRYAHCSSGCSADGVTGKDAVCCAWLIRSCRTKRQTQ